MKIEFGRTEKIDVLEKFEKENTENIELKNRKGDLILGRTFSLGQKLGYWIGEAIAKKVKGTDYKVLVDVGLSESDHSGDKRKIIYPDILIVKKENTKSFNPNLISMLQKENFAGMFKFTSNGKIWGKEDYDKAEIDCYRAYCYIEVKLDVGWFNSESFINDFERITKWAKSQKQLKFSRAVLKEPGEFNQLSKRNKNKPEEEYYYLNNLLILDPNLKKHIIIGCEMNDHGNINEYIRSNCPKYDIKGPHFLVDKTIHIRGINTNNIQKCVTTDTFVLFDNQDDLI